LDENGMLSEHVARSSSLLRVYLQVISYRPDYLYLYAGLEPGHDRGVVIGLTA
jgi:hypothetical protein